MTMGPPYWGDQGGLGPAAPALINPSIHHEKLLRIRKRRKNPCELNYDCFFRKKNEKHHLIYFY